MFSSVQNPNLLRLPHLRHLPLQCIHTSLNPSAIPNLSPPSSQILTIRKSLLSRETTAVEIVKGFLSRIRRTEPHLKSFLYVSPDGYVLQQAEEIDRKIRHNEELGSLAGVVVGVKDNICTSDMPSTAGSKIMENYTPPFDATCVRKLKENGAIIVGKTNLDEFGMGSSTEASAYQVTLGIYRGYQEDHLGDLLHRFLLDSVWYHWEAILVEVLGNLQLSVE